MEKKVPGPDSHLGAIQAVNILSLQMGIIHLAATLLTIDSITKINLAKIKNCTTYANSL
jgi:hypothetical protein